MNSEYHKTYDESPTTDYPAIAAVSTYRFRCNSIIGSVFAFHFSITENWFTTEPSVRNSFCFCAYQDTNNKPARTDVRKELEGSTLFTNCTRQLRIKPVVTYALRDLRRPSSWRNRLTYFYFYFLVGGRGGGKGVSHRQQRTQCIKGDKELLVCKRRFSFTYVL